jgi:hypothetical protein
LYKNLEQISSSGVEKADEENTSSERKIDSGKKIQSSKYLGPALISVDFCQLSTK